MGVHGPVDFVVVGFAGGRIHESLGPALREQVARGTIRIIDLLFVEKDLDGHSHPFELADVEADEAYQHIRGVPQSIDGLIGPEDIDSIAAQMAPGATAMIVLFEHMWLRDLRSAIEASGGEILRNERIPGPVVDAVELAAPVR
jgi:hypothetical protein